MNNPNAALLLICILLAFPASSWVQDVSTYRMDAIGPEAFEVMRHFYDYDQDIPLEARVIDRLEELEYVREKIVFRGTHNSRVPGYLAIPTNGTSPYPCVLLLHGVGSTKEDWWKDDSFPSGGQLTKDLLSSGFAVLALDAEYHGERLLNNDFESPMVFLFEKGWVHRARDMIVQSALEYRRAMDYLGTRAEVDTSRLGVIGYSMGGMMVFSLAAVCNRVDGGASEMTVV